MMGDMLRNVNAAILRINTLKAKAVAECNSMVELHCYRCLDKLNRLRRDLEKQQETGQ